MLLPKRVKYRRQHRPKQLVVLKAVTVTFGEYGLQATTTLGSHLVKSNLLVLQ